MQVSIVMGCYNMGRTVGEAITSVLRQTYTDFEFIVYDNCSTDNSLQEIEKFKDDPRVRIIKGETHLDTAYKSGNYVASFATKDFLMGVCADDRLAPTHVAEVMAAYAKLNDEVCMVATQVAHITEDGNAPTADCDDPRIHVAQAQNRSRMDWLKFFRTGNCYFGGGMWRTSVWKALNGFDETYQKLGDLDIMIRALKAGYSFHIIEKPLYDHRMSVDAATAPTIEKLRVSNEEMKRILATYYPPLFDKEKIKDKKIVITTPFYMAQGFAPYMSSVVQACKALSELGIKWDFWNICGDSYVERVKNSFLQLFLKSDATDMVMIDSDLKFDVEGFLRIALCDHDLIGGSYPMKNGWTNFVGVPKLDENKKFTWDGMGNIRAEFVSGGFTKFSRNCIQKMSEHYKSHGYKDPTASFKEYTPALFECAITQDGLRATEDYVFCKKWTDIGGEVWIDPTVKFQHYGVKGWLGCFIDHVGRAMIQPVKEIKQEAIAA
jgi:glycosyltransferase involved in cell wall biosynthesis